MEARTVRALGGEQLAWDVDTHLLATIVDLLAGANWQRSGVKGAPRPKPLDRPGQKRAGERKLGTARPLEEVRRLLDIEEG